MGIPLAQIEGVAWMTNRQSHCRLTLGRAGTAIPDRRYNGKVGLFDGKARKGSPSSAADPSVEPPKPA
jgi:hypothetical protein